MATSPNTDPRIMRPRRDDRTTLAIQKVQDMLSAVPEELVDRNTLQALLLAADDGQYAVRDAERYHGLWMEAQDECRHMVAQVEQAQRGIVLNAGDPEPPNRAVVIDSEGDAWQRDDRKTSDTEPGWYCAGGTAQHTWDALLNAYGPVRVVHTPKA